MGEDPAPRTRTGRRAPREADPPQLWDGETLLRGEDVNTLAPGRWLGDEVIGFWLEYLALVCREERVDPPRYPFEPVLGLPPGMAFTLAHLPGPEAAEEMIEIDDSGSDSGLGTSKAAVVVKQERSD